MPRSEFDARAALSRAARRCFAEYGFFGATSGMIAARAGVTAGLVNYYFGGKDKLYAAVLEDVLSEPAAPSQEEARADVRVLLAQAISPQAGLDADRSRILAWEAMRPSEVGARLIKGWRAARRARIRVALAGAFSLSAQRLDLFAYWLEAGLMGADPANPLNSAEALAPALAGEGAEAMIEAAFAVIEQAGARPARKRPSSPQGARR